MPRKQKRKKPTGTMNLYKFDVHFGRMGRLTGIFVATATEVKEAIGLEVDFGEALGKHSEVVFELEKGHITKLTDDHVFINKAMEYGLVPMGRNPLLSVRLYCEECDEYYHAEDGCWGCRYSELDEDDDGTSEDDEE